MQFNLNAVLVSERITATGGRATGFDYLRFSLAVAVILFHTVVTGYGLEIQARVAKSNPGILLDLILPMFFALSGFLVAGSLERAKSILVFLGLRVLRIFPALAVDTLFCAVILGPIFTSLALSDYFSHADFRSYFLNIIGNIHYYLPGVFESNPMSRVNGQLWTIPVELECYVVLTLLALLGIHRYRWAMLAIFVLLLGALETRVLMGMAEPWSGRVLLLCFLCGVIALQFRDFIRLSLPVFAVAVVLSFVGLRYPALTYVGVIPITYITVYLGLLNPRKSRLLQSGDYSYGLFLYGFPIQQALVALTPAARLWYWNAAMAVPLALVFSIMSWHLVEKRVMARKHLLQTAHARCSAALGRARLALFPSTR